jgi:hypothetical protein
LVFIGSSLGDSIDYKFLSELGVKTLMSLQALHHDDDAACSAYGMNCVRYGILASPFANFANDPVFWKALDRLVKDTTAGIKGYLQDTMNARLTGTKSTGNGRRESFAHITLPRMTNTYMRAGNTPPEEILASVQKGIFAVNFGGGQVDITSGKFVFSASEAYLIENGKVGAPIKGATLIGNGPDVLTRVSMVGNDLKLDDGVGTCGKEGQSVPVGVGQPTLRIDGLTVGGTG